MDDYDSFFKVCCACGLCLLCCSVGGPPCVYLSKFSRLSRFCVSMNSRMPGGDDSWFAGTLSCSKLTPDLVLFGDKNIFRAQPISCYNVFPVLRGSEGVSAALSPRMLVCSSTKHQRFLPGQDDAVAVHYLARGESAVANY